MFDACWMPARACDPMFSVRALLMAVFYLTSIYRRILSVCTFVAVEDMLRLLRGCCSEGMHSLSQVDQGDQDGSVVSAP